MQQSLRLRVRWDPPGDALWACVLLLRGGWRLLSYAGPLACSSKLRLVPKLLVAPGANVGSDAEPGSGLLQAELRGVARGQPGGQRGVQLVDEALEWRAAAGWVMRRSPGC